MLLAQEYSVDDGSPTWDRATPVDWRDVDRALRGIARRRCKLDAEEARWLREAERLEIWRPLGMVSALDYLERVLGHTPHVANERLRVSRSLGELPVLTAAFADGKLQFSAIRELTRVATPETETDWRNAAVGKNVREIEELVAGRRRGAKPGDPADPKVRTHVVRFELNAEVFARLRQTRSALTDERGGYLDDHQLVTALCEAVLDRASSATEPTGRAKFQIAVVVRALRSGHPRGSRRDRSDRRRRARSRSLRRPAHRIDRRRHPRARAPGHPAERGSVRVAPRRWPLPDAGLSFIHWVGDSPHPPPCRRRQPRSEQPLLAMLGLSHGRPPRDPDDHAHRVRSIRDPTPRGAAIRRRCRRETRRHDHPHASP